MVVTLLIIQLAGIIASSLQANMLKAAISSGHLTLTKNMANPDESLADIVLTDEGAEQILTPQDKQYCNLAVELARKSVAENDGELHPYVGAVVVKDGQVISTGYREKREMAGTQNMVLLGRSTTWTTSI